MPFNGVVAAYIYNPCPCSNKYISNRSNITIFTLFLRWHFLAINKSRSPLSSHHRICYILIFSLSCSFLLCFYNSQFHLLDIFIKYIILPLFSILIISTSWLLCKHIRFKEYSVINSLDRNSMGIYIIHHVLLIAAISNDSIAYVIKAHYIAAPVAMFFIALSTSWLISSFLNRLKISSYIFG